MKGLFQKLGIASKKGIFDQQYKTCIDKTLTDVQTKRQSQLDMKLKSKNRHLFVQYY